MIRSVALLWVGTAMVGTILVFPQRVLGQTAQPPEHALAALEIDETVWVRTSDGRVVKGRFRGWTDSTFEWTTPAGVVHTPLEDVERMEVPDPIRDGIFRGAMIGAAAGGVLGVLAGLGLSCKTDCGPGYSRTRDILTGTLAFALVAAGEGVVAGAILDATIHRRRLVFSKSGTPRVVLGPIIGAGQVGAGAVLRW